MIKILFQEPLVRFLVKTMKEFKGQKHYYFNIAAFFDPDNGFIMCLIKMCMNNIFKTN